MPAEDAEFSRNAAEGARENVQKYGLKTVYDKTYPPGTTDFSPIIRAIQATNPELVVICSGVGTQNCSRCPFSLDLSLLLMAVYWIPTMPPPIILGFRPNSLADCTMPTELFGYGIDPLGYYLGGWGYAYLQVLQQAIEGSKSLNDDTLAEYLRSPPSPRSWPPISSSVRTANGPNLG